MFHWLHHLFNPHCEYCMEDEAAKHYCNTCEVLKMELAAVRQERDKLLDRVLNPEENRVRVEEPEEEKPLIPLNKRTYIPFNVRRQTLEAEDRARARVMRERNESLNIPATSTDTPLTVEQMEKVIIDEGEDDAVPGSNAQV